MPGGRKSLKDEIQVVKYMTELAPATFKFIQAMYDTGDKKDKQWASEQMIKLYSKAVPQAGDDPSNPIYTAQITGMEIKDDNENPVQDQEPKTDTGSQVLDR